MTRTVAYWSTAIALIFAIGPVAAANGQSGWSVNAASFESSLAATVLVTVDGSTASNASDELAAFVGDEIRGVAPTTEVNGQLYFFLLVYANGTGETVTFTYYDGANDRFCEVQETISLAPNGILGALSSPFQLSATCPGSTSIEPDLPWEAALVSSVYPNPAVDHVFAVVDTSIEATVQLSLVDATGRIVARQTSGVGPGRSKIALRLHGVSAGTYFLVSDTGSTRSVKPISVTGR